MVESASLVDYPTMVESASQVKCPTMVDAPVLVESGCQVDPPYPGGVRLTVKIPNYHGGSFTGGYG